MNVSVTLTPGETWKEIQCKDAFINSIEVVQITDASMMIDGILNVLEVVNATHNLCNIRLNGFTVARVQFSFGELKVFRTKEVHVTDECVPHNGYALTINVDFKRKGE